MSMAIFQFAIFVYQRVSPSPIICLAFIPCLGWSRRSWQLWPHDGCLVPRLVKVPTNPPSNMASWKMDHFSILFLARNLSSNIFQPCGIFHFQRAKSISVSASHVPMATRNSRATGVHDRLHRLSGHNDHCHCSTWPLFGAAVLACHKGFPDLVGMPWSYDSYKML